MLQRIQSVYLFLAAIATVVCLCLPVGYYADGEGMRVATEYNLWLAFAEGGHALTVWPLFVVLALQAALSLYAIFCYHNRIAQSRLCVFGSLLTVGWYAVYAVLGLAMGCGVDGTSFSPSWEAVLPAVSLVLLLLARRSIMADERLVRAADRIR